MNSIIFFHAIFAILAIPLGLLIFLKKKGTFLHKRLGWFWILFLVIVSISAVFISIYFDSNLCALNVSEINLKVS